MYRLKFFEGVYLLVIHDFCFVFGIPLRDLP